MRRRNFLQALLGSSALAIALPAPSRPAILIQDSPLAGFQYHAGERLWPALQVGSPLQLRREPGNRHDVNAVAGSRSSSFRRAPPRRENHSVAQMLDRGQPLRARIIARRRSNDPWERIRLSVEVPV